MERLIGKVLRWLLVWEMKRRATARAVRKQKERITRLLRDD